jgi:membrane-bound lytic murein transglycosylase D
MGALLLALLVAPALAEPEVPPPADDAPAQEPAGESIWDFIETAEGTQPEPSVLEASQELAAERSAELGFIGSIGAEAPVAYYLDPLGATARDPLQTDTVNPKEFDIPVVVNDDVKKWMTYFLGPGRKYYTRYLQRSTKWLPMMRRELEARDLPRDLVFLSMIESGFSVGATSYAAAAGLWQFMPATARQYGLRVDWWVDDRRDPELATGAALEYLAYLHRMFSGNWWLSWASYNGGEGRVMRATQRLGTTDFWAIAHAGALHPETANYVPKLIAAAILGRHPERYGFVNLEYEEEWAFDRMDVPGSTSVEVLARCAGLSEEDFLALNPWIRRWALPPDPETQAIRLPSGTAAAFAEAFAKVSPAERITFQRHTVKRGESLGSIARKYGVSSDELARLNRIRNANRISVGTELIIPGGSTKVASTESRPQGDNQGPKPEPKAEASSGPRKTYTVRSGDTLGTIAQKHKVSIADLQKWNGIRGANIQAGQKLVVSAGSAAKPPERPGDKDTAAAKASKTHTVRKGDTLGTIAARYDCTVAELKAWNKLKGDTIYAGQKLKVSG